MSFWARLEQAPWVVVYAKSVPIDSAIAALHYFSFFLVVGTITLMDLRLLGLIGWRRSVRQVARQLFPWTWTALGFAIISGFLLFTTEADDFVASKMFLFKLAVMLVGIVLAALIQRQSADLDEQAVIPGSAKFLAIVSLVIWLGVILAGAEIANYNAV